MSVFILAIFCLTTSNLPWFLDLKFQVPMHIIYIYVINIGSTLLYGTVNFFVIHLCLNPNMMRIEECRNITLVHHQFTSLLILQTGIFILECMFVNPHLLKIKLNMVFWKPLPFLDSCSNFMSLILCLSTYWYSPYSLLHNNGHADFACISPHQSHTKASQQDNPVSCMSSDISNSSIFVLDRREQVEINEIFLIGLLSRHKLPFPIILNPRRKKKSFIFKRKKEWVENRKWR